MSATPPLRLGFSPCPNDTFIFHALVHGLLPANGIAFAPCLADVETLNHMAIRGELDVAKVSAGALPYLLEEYVVLRSGGAIGRGCGPLLVAREPLPTQRLTSARIAIPGHHTTANLLLSLFAGKPGEVAAIDYADILPAVAAGHYDAGLIIHESRFTFAEHGLVQIVDLGEWWDSMTGMPLPLGVIVARRGLGSRVATIEAAIRASVAHAFQNPARSAAYVRAHARELSEDVTRRHIDLYVTPASLDLGEEGERAIRLLIARATAAGLTPPTATGLFHL